MLPHGDLNTLWICVRRWIPLPIISFFFFLSSLLALRNMQMARKKKSLKRHSLKKERERESERKSVGVFDLNILKVISKKKFLKKKNEEDKINKFLFLFLLYLFYFFSVRDKLTSKVVLVLALSLSPLIRTTPPGVFPRCRYTFIYNHNDVVRALLVHLDYVVKSNW